MREYVCVCLEVADRVTPPIQSLTFLETGNPESPLRPLEGLRPHNGRAAYAAGDRYLTPPCSWYGERRIDGVR